MFVHEFTGDVGPVSVTTKQSGNTFVSTAVSAFGKTVVESKCGSASYSTAVDGVGAKVRPSLLSESCWYVSLGLVPSLTCRKTPVLGLLHPLTPKNATAPWLARHVRLLVDSDPVVAAVRQICRDASSHFSLLQVLLSSLALFHSERHEVKLVGREPPHLGEKRRVVTALACAALSCFLFFGLCVRCFFRTPAPSSRPLSLFHSTPKQGFHHNNRTVHAHSPVRKATRMTFNAESGISLPISSMVRFKLFRGMV